MSKHSIGAYRILLKMRTARTLLVEGESDKSVIQRLLLDHPVEERTIADRPAIDTPSLLSDPQLQGLGNKEKVELIADKFPPDQGKFMALVDREWEAFDAETLQLSGIEHEYLTPGPIKIRTFGHSIENYFFESSTLISLLRRQFAYQLTPGMLRLIEDGFANICTIALAYSLAAKKHQLISRLPGLLSHQYVMLQGSHFEIVEEFATALEKRGVELDEAKRFIGTANALAHEIADRKLTMHTMKWSSHGHLGHEAMWVCAAKILEASGISGDTVEQVERGMQVDKLKHGADVLAINPHERRPLDWLVRWLVGLEQRELPA